MTQFTQLGLSGDSNQKPLDQKKDQKKDHKNDNKKSDDKQTQNHGKRQGLTDKKAAAFVGTIVAGAVAGIFLLQTGGCSREESKPVANMPANAVTFNPAPAPVATNLPPQAPAVAPHVKKAVKKPRPAVVGYSDQIYGVSFRYPRKYMLKGGDTTTGSTDNSKTDISQEVAMNFAQPGGLSIVKVEVPKDSFPGTDLTYAAFNLNVNKTTTEDQCYQFALPQPDSSDQAQTEPSKVKLGVMELEEVENLSGPSTRQSDAKYYHVYDNGSCYEFALGLATEDGTDQDLTPVNREQVFKKLENILATVKIQPLAKPEVKQEVKPEVAKTTPQNQQEVPTRSDVKAEEPTSTPEAKAESAVTSPGVKSQDTAKDTASTQAAAPAAQDVTQQ